MESIAAGIDLIAAVMFFSSCYAKMISFTDFTLEIASYRIVPGRWLNEAAVLVLVLECGLFLAFSAGGILEGVKEAAAAVLLLAFTGLTRRRSLAGGEQSCSCFGVNHPLGRFPALRNVAVAALLLGDLFILRQWRGPHSAFLTALTAAAIALLLEAYKLYRETKKVKAYA